jgi:hypothetical protein
VGYILGAATAAGMAGEHAGPYLAFEGRDRAAWKRPRLRLPLVNRAWILGTMKGPAKSFEALRGFLATVPIVDCHDHTSFAGPQYTDPVQVVTGGYFFQDLEKLSSVEEIQRLKDPEIPLEERWPSLERLWKAARFTGFGRTTDLVLKHFYGESELTLAALQRMRSKLPDLSDDATFDRVLGEANIQARLINPVAAHFRPTVKPVIDGTYKMSPRGKLVLRLPHFHLITCRRDLEENVAPLGREVGSLDVYVESCREIFTAFKRYGAVAAKDQSAYHRGLDFKNPTRAEAEEVFQWIMADPQRQIAYPDGVKALDDWLFHRFLEMARDLELPVQVHTGMLGGWYKDVRPVNAMQLVPLLQMHRDVRFDLFHLNWPYGGELLSLAKNYPNVAINFCWAHALDPIYCQRFLEQALSVIPHVKIHGFGADYVGFADRAFAQAEIARDNIAIALSNLVEIDYFGMDDAKEVALAILFDNPNRFFKLGLARG